MDYHYDAEFLFLEYLQKADKNKVYDILLIMAYSYCQRKAYDEAHQIFSKLKNYNPKSLVVWLGLSVTSLNLNKIDQAEEALSIACKLDPCCSAVWGNILLTNFQKFKSNQIDKNYLKSLNKIYQNLKIYDLT